jgi:hypothetical protein
MTTTMISDGRTVDIAPSELAKLRRLIAMPDRQFQALIDVADQQVALEDAPEPPPRARLRVIDSNGSIVHPIACIERLTAITKDAPAPECSWARSGSDYVCTVCSEVVTPDAERFDALAHLFGDVAANERPLVRE